MMGVCVWYVFIREEVEGSVYPNLCSPLVLGNHKNKKKRAAVVEVSYQFSRKAT